jgi:hypothetical protein
MINPLVTSGAFPCEIAYGAGPGTPRRAGRGLFMVLQAFIDESYNSQTGIYVLGGYIASAEAWDNFLKEWKEMLPDGTPDKHGRYHFKMREMAVSENRMQRVPKFFRIIEKYVLLAISCKASVIDIKRAKARLWVPNVSVSYVDALANPWKFEFVALLDMFYHNTIIGIGNRSALLSQMVKRLISILTRDQRRMK